MKQMMKCLVLILAVAFMAVPASAMEKNMVYSSPYNITTLDPSVSYSTEVQYMANMYETLIKVNPPGSKDMFSYVLATGFTASDDGLAYTFTLRKGVKFHDGTAFTAEAVKFSIDRTKKIGKGAAFIWGDLKEVKIVDDYTVKLILNSPAPLPMIAASANGSYIMSPSVGDKGQEWFDQGNEAGSGPYTLKNYKSGESWILAKFDDYWGGWSGKHVENILVKYTKEGLVQLKMLQSNEAMLAGRIPIDSYPKVQKAANTKVIAGPSYVNYMAFFNTMRPPLDQQKVRQALAHAIPYDDLIKIGWNGSATQARGPVPKGQFGYSEKVIQYEYNLEKAKKLLAQAGFPDGGFKLTLTYAAENVSEGRIAPLIQSEFKKLGIEVEVKGIVWTSQWAKAKGNPKEAQDIFLLMWWPTYSDPYETLYTLLHNEKDKPVWNLAYYVNPAYDNMIRKAYEMTGSNPDKALDLYIQAQNMVQKDVPVAWLVDIVAEWPMNEKLQGLVINPAYPNTPFFYDMYIE
jgi:peptide/nickel transport system substrate-binding protein